MTHLGYEFVYIYALPDGRGYIRYIGRSPNPDARLRTHWNDRDLGGDLHEELWWHPKNMWLRTLKTCPEMRILAIVEETGGHEDDKFIIAYRKAFPGKLTNKSPLPIPAPERELAKRLAAADDPDFDWESFQAEKRPENRPEWTANNREMLRRRNADPEFQEKVHTARWTSENRAKQSAKMKAKAKPPCRIDDGDGPCGRPHQGHGMCSMHYQRWKAGILLTGPTSRKGEACQEDDGDGPCGREHHANGLCTKHYQRWEHHGPAWKPEPPKGPCQIDDGDGPCGKPHSGLGMCEAHYQRQKYQERKANRNV